MRASGSKHFLRWVARHHVILSQWHGVRCCAISQCCSSQPMRTERKPSVSSMRTTRHLRALSYACCSGHTHFGTCYSTCAAAGYDIVPLTPQTDGPVAIQLMYKAQQGHEARAKFDAPIPAVLRKSKANLLLSTPLVTGRVELFWRSQIKNAL